MRWIVAALAVAAIALSVWRLEADRAGLDIAALEVEGGTPATLYLAPGTEPVPVVVIAHGFAGSRQLMEPFALTLAQAGYLVASFDFEGHGRNPRPMSGDVTTVQGTTQFLMDETARVAAAALAHPRADGRLAYLGHSMASDIIVRQAQEDPPADAVVAVSMFSRAVTADAPANLLVIVGDWEARLKEEALRALHLADADAGADETVGSHADGTARRVVFSPAVEHVGVLYSATSLRAARDWLDASFARDATDGADTRPASLGPAALDAAAGGATPVALRGGWIVLLLVGVVALGWPLARLLPPGGPANGVPRPVRLSRARFWTVALVPALAVPLVLWPIETAVLPVLVADYLAVHFALYGALTLLFLARWGVLRGQFPARVWWIALAVAVFGIAVFGGALDRYVASFWPHAGRAAVIAGLAVGTVAYMLGDAALTEGGRAPFWRVLVARGAFLASLGAAVALDFQSLFFLVIILPVIVLFFLLFGMMAGWVGRRTGLPAAAGMGLGLVLAWALGVTFPMFAA
ncbi:alpha/beta fold hydrolase [Rhodobaculum claviforme]|uniref:Alpha/beta hydrolase n=1 Tax=Rhodobaculum claviforme TaxID=1549854 RepID=A0A934WHT5_9RHOB|nr:alpha/beta fold hydrolase [Rhodobaculum claviforme]MBK5926057.1 alpha/beta hydrolase [Rhodobaculum claviforme]